MYFYEQVLWGFYVIMPFRKKMHLNSHHKSSEVYSIRISITQSDIVLTPSRHAVLMADYDVNAFSTN